jgi:hypothetical protein
MHVGCIDYPTFHPHINPGLHNRAEFPGNSIYQQIHNFISTTLFSFLICTTAKPMRWLSIEASIVDISKDAASTLQLSVQLSALPSGVFCPFKPTCALHQFLGRLKVAFSANCDVQWDCDVE